MKENRNYLKTRLLSFKDLLMRVRGMYLLREPNNYYDHVSCLSNRVSRVAGIILIVGKTRNFSQSQSLGRLGIFPSPRD